MASFSDRANEKLFEFVMNTGAAFNEISDFGEIYNFFDSGDDMSFEDFFEWAEYNLRIDKVIAKDDLFVIAKKTLSNKLLIISGKIKKYASASSLREYPEYSNLSLSISKEVITNAYDFENQKEDLTVISTDNPNGVTMEQIYLDEEELENLIWFVHLVGATHSIGRK